MTKEYTYKLQGDGRDSWTCVEKEGDVIINKYMVYEDPNKSDLMRLLEKITPEEKQYLKDILK